MLSSVISFSFLRFLFAYFISCTACVACAGTIKSYSILLFYSICLSSNILILSIEGISSNFLIFSVEGIIRLTGTR